MFGESNIHKSHQEQSERKEKRQVISLIILIKRKGIIKKEEFFRSTKRQGNMEKYLRLSRKETGTQKIF